MLVHALVLSPASTHLLCPSVSLILFASRSHSSLRLSQMWLLLRILFFGGPDYNPPSTVPFPRQTESIGLAQGTSSDATSTPQLDDILDTQDPRISCPHIPEITPWDWALEGTSGGWFSSVGDGGGGYVKRASGWREENWLPRCLNSCLTHTRDRPVVIYPGKSFQTSLIRSSAMIIFIGHETIMWQSLNICDFYTCLYGYVLDVHLATSMWLQLSHKMGLIMFTIVSSCQIYWQVHSRCLINVCNE